MIQCQNIFFEKKLFTLRYVDYLDRPGPDFVNRQCRLVFILIVLARRKAQTKGHGVLLHSSAGEMGHNSKITVSWIGG